MKPSADSGHSDDSGHSGPPHHEHPEAASLPNAFWAVLSCDDSQVQRVVWEGMACPLCEAALTHFIGPGDEEETLTCSRSSCEYRIELLRKRPTPQEVQAWVNTDLKGYGAHN